MGWRTWTFKVFIGDNAQAIWNVVQFFCNSRHSMSHDELWVYMSFPLIHRFGQGYAKVYRTILAITTQANMHGSQVQWKMSKLNTMSFVCGGYLTIKEGFFGFIQVVGMVLMLELVEWSYVFGKYNTMVNCFSSRIISVALELCWNGVGWICLWHVPSFPSHMVW